MLADNKMVGANGCKFIDGAVTNVKLYMLVVDADAVLSVLTGEDGTNYLTAIGLTGKTITKGTILTITAGENFNKVTVASGALIGYNA